MDTSESTQKAVNNSEHARHRSLEIQRTAAANRRGLQLDTIPLREDCAQREVPMTAMLRFMKREFKQISTNPVDRLANCGRCTHRVASGNSLKFKHRNGCWGNSGVEHLVVRMLQLALNKPPTEVQFIKYQSDGKAKKRVAHTVWPSATATTVPPDADAHEGGSSCTS
jgi:hypothetical protein